ncbi:glycoside hydrolase family 31 protein [Persicirhabdus sediminis]|uniref:DUF5110 domain-containing protein n=1 Tax=Persicirhabdus sediminis TaxID=454144 RepID=A0A8J7MH17_9BACT|nr:glycoside hydrolase family 31 protein [Persicirhabdus sediminis]MBK1791689.1 DUF5110 domain-containing protein [Persicirhabdus sediminis]
MKALTKIIPIHQFHPKQKIIAAATLAILPMTSLAQSAPNSVKSVDARSNGAQMTLEQGKMDISFVSPSLIRVRVTQNPSFTASTSNIVLPRDVETSAQVNEQDGAVIISAGELQIKVDKKTSALSFLSTTDGPLLSEPNSPRKFEAIEITELKLTDTKEVATIDGGRVEGEIVETGKTTKAWSVKHNFNWADDEAIYGLGSHEENVLNLRGSLQYVYQQNMKIAIPVIVSTNGYGILYDACGEIQFNDTEEGSFIDLDAIQDLDYYFIYGPELDDIVAGYRDLTGSAPMMPRYAFGYVQSKERYKSQDEIISIVEEYRKRKLPLDIIVQDWKYWPTGWGIKQFRERSYPDPTAMCERVHELGAHIMLSIWPHIKGDHPEPKDMAEKGFMLNNGKTYDAYNEVARSLYWKYTNDNLFKHGIDAWWCDCTEPIEADWTGKTKLSPKERRDINIASQRATLGREKLNSYSLYHSQGIYENQRKTSEEKRVVNLTRSGYAGQQRYGTISWTGDISARWEVLEQQIPCGLNFTVTGSPYWTNDIGAFFVKPSKRTWFRDGIYPEGVADLGFRELYTRWFQYGSFLTMFRSHGTDTPREVWQFGEPGTPFYDTLAKYLELRYKLMPYTYSIAGQTSHNNYTMTRLLAFDFRKDPKVHDIKTQFMYGPALMVCPVVTPMYYGAESTELKDVAKTREVYLPNDTDWYDYWTGKKLTGGQTITADAPLETMPLYVRAGSIIPEGPVVQHTGENLDADWTIRVYPGSDGEFTVYEDEGDNYNYEKGQFSTWKISWDEAKQTLSIGERQGSYPGMVNSRKLNIALMNDSMDQVTPKVAKTVQYTGEAIDVVIKSLSGE